VLTTGVALAVLLRREGFAGAHALVLGTPAFKAEVLAAGLVDGDGADQRSIDLVVVGGFAQGTSVVASGSSS
jgi:ribonucleotide monophosphatase NagD (HAD superfamily)